MGSCLSRVIRSRRTRSSASSSSAAAAASTAGFAKVISINGDLRQYPTPALVSDVLSSEISSTSSSSSSSSSFFICNSDNLYYNEIIPALPADHQLRPNRIYFILPHSMRDHALSASDMASLAVKATAALQFTSSSTPPPHSNSSDRRRKKSRVSPLSIFFPLRTKTQDPCNFLDLDHQDQEEEYYVHPQDYDYDLTIGLTPPIKNHKKKSSTASASVSASAENINIGMRRSGSVRKLQRYASRRAKLAVRSFKLRLTTIYEGTILS